MDNGTTALARVADAEIVPEYDGLTMAVTPAVAKQRLAELQSFVASIMVRDLDYGRIPGTDKDVLYQPGAQKLCEAYGFAADFETAEKVENWDLPLFHYEVRCRLTSRRDGRFIGAGIGSCNSREKRYAGRWAFDNEIPAGMNKAALKKKEGRSKKTGRPYTQYWIPNDDIFTLVNTIKKMACKRALVHAVIGATRSAGMFTQDVEDMADHVMEDDAPQESEAAPPPPKQKFTDEEMAKTHHELRMLITAAKSGADLDIAKTFMGTAWKAKRVTKAQMDDLIAYGKTRRADIELAHFPEDGNEEGSDDGAA